jgi:hypothetical protein
LRRVRAVRAVSRPQTFTKLRYCAVDVVLGYPVSTGIAWHQGVDGSSSAPIVHVHQRGATCGISNVLVALQRLSSCVLHTQLAEQALQSLAPRAAEVGGPLDDSFCTANCDNMSHGMMAGLLKVRLGVGMAHTMPITGQRLSRDGSTAVGMTAVAMTAVSRQLGVGTRWV